MVNCLRAHVCLIYLYELVCPRARSNLSAYAPQTLPSLILEFTRSLNEGSKSHLRHFDFPLLMIFPFSWR